MVDLRRYIRAAKEYRLEYGPFPLSTRDGEFQTSMVRNIGGGGLLFESPDPIPVGRQLVLKIFLRGWRLMDDEVVEAEDDRAEALITAIGQVQWVKDDPAQKRYQIGVEFLGRILP